MTLSEAVRSLVETKGLSILTTPMALNILSDYKAFDEYPCSKNILRTILEDGYMDKIVSLTENYDKAVLERILSVLIDKLGFRQEASLYVINSIVTSIGLNGINDECPRDGTQMHKFQLAASTKTNPLSNNCNVANMQFLGIPIEGDLDIFVKALQSKNLFHYIGLFEDNSGALFIGGFGGIEDCRIEIVKSQYTNKVYCVSVLTPEQRDWFDLGVFYFLLKDKLTLKYGKPSYESEMFHYYDGVEDYKKDNMHLLQEGKASYLSMFRFEHGSVTLSIEPFCRVQINYTDKKNESAHIESRDSQI